MTSLSCCRCMPQEKNACFRRKQSVYVPVFAARRCDTRIINSDDIQGSSKLQDSHVDWYENVTRYQLVVHHFVMPEFTSVEW